MATLSEVADNNQINELDRQTAVTAYSYAKGIPGALANPPAFLIIIAGWPRNKREVIRVSLDEYQGRTIIDLRCWWYDDQGELKPGRSGLTLALKHLPTLASGPADASARAEGLGLQQVQRTD
jgi:Transcriptional Coactivator p15 (PC4)